MTRFPPGDPIYDPAFKAAAAAWHSLIDYAEACAEAAVDADPARLTVTDDYEGARQALKAAVDSRILHLVQDAAMRFQAAVEAPKDLSALVAGDSGGENELALMGAVMMLRGSLHHLGEALDDLGRAFPDPSEE